MYIKIDAQKLYLICALRGETVEAKNLKPYSGTKEVTDFRKKWRNTIKRKNLESAELKTDIREFHLVPREIRNSDGFILSDNDGRAWYEPCADVPNEWAYDGEFKLMTPLSPMEKDILKHYTNPPLAKRKMKDK